MELVMPEAWDKLSEIYGSPDATQTSAQMAQPGARFQEQGPSIQDIYAKATSREPGWTYGEVLPIARGPEGQMRPAVPGMVYDAFSGMNRALKGELPQYEHDPETGEPRLSQDLIRSGGAAAALAATGALGSPVPPAGSLQAMHGLRSHLADTRRWAEAVNMEKRGLPNELIAANTGWFRGIDGKWRFEVPDTGSQWLPTVPTRQHGYTKEDVTNFPSFNLNTKLGDVFEGPILKGYPDLADIPVTGMGFNTGQGGYSPPNFSRPGSPERIFLGSQPLDKSLSTLLHEAGGHAIQEREGFAPGGTTQQFLPASAGRATTQIQKATTEIEDLIESRNANPFAIRMAIKEQLEGRPIKNIYYQQELAKAQMTPAELQRYMKLIQIRDRLTNRYEEARRQYQNIPGEREARNIQRRFESDYYDTYPLSTMDPLK